MTRTAPPRHCVAARGLRTRGAVVRRAWSWARAGDGDAARRRRAVPERQAAAARADLVPRADRAARRAARAPRERADVPRSVADLARRLPLERKVAQLFLLGFQGTDLNAEIFRRLRRLDLGGIVVARRTTGPDAARRAGRRGDRDRAPGRPRAAVGARQPGRRRAQLAPGPAAGRGARGHWARPPRPRREARASDRQHAARPRRDRRARAGGRRRARVRVGPRRARLLGRPRGGGGLRRRDGHRLPRASACSAPSSISRASAPPTSRPSRGRPASASTSSELRERDLLPFRRPSRPASRASCSRHALYPMSDFTVPASLSPRDRHRPAARRARLRGRGDHRRPRRPGDHARPTRCPTPRCGRCAAGADMLCISGPAGDQQAAYAAVLRAVRSGRLPRRRSPGARRALRSRRTTA